MVWSVDTTGSNSEIRGQLLSSSGALVGSQMVLANSYLGRAPSVASINATNRFLVTCIDQNTYTIPQMGVFVQPFLKCFSVAAATGVISNAVVMAGGGFQDPDVQTAHVGGDSRIGLFGSAENALVVYREVPYQQGIQVTRSALVHVPSSGDPVVLSTTTQSSLPVQTGAFVSPTTGGAGHWLLIIATHLNGGPVSPYQRFTAQLLDSAGNACGGPITLWNGGPTVNLGAPSIATRDGNEFVVVWEEISTHTIQLRRLVWSGTCSTGSWSLDPVLSPVEQVAVAHTPAITFAKDKYLLSWAQPILFATTKVWVKGLDPVTCANCGAELRVDSGSATEVTPAIASRWSGGDATSDEAMVVWSNPAIRGRVVEAIGAGGTVTALGGGCGISGFNDFATYSGTPTLGTTFSIDLLNPTSPVLGLAVGFSPVGLACGSCTLVGAMDILLPVTASAPVVVPCDANLIGVELWSQWLQFRASGCPILPTIGLSNCLKFTIGE